MLLKDQVVIVSGIGPGLGEKLAILAAEEGAKLAITARTESRLMETVDKIRGRGIEVDVICVPTDIGDPAQCENLAKRTVEAFGRIDVLINSAYTGGSAFKAVADADLDDWRKTMDVNLFGLLNLTQAVVPQMKVQKSGSIVMVNTMVTRKPIPTQGGYAASKSALTAATAHLAAELGRFGIRVNSAYLGYMWGPNVEIYVKVQAKATGASVEEVKAGIARNIPLGRIPSDSECAKPVIFLASDLSSAMTGASMDVNGGEYLPC